jgi:hypothetical protein
MSHVEMKELKIQLQGLLDTLGLFSVVCGEEGQRVASMCGLPTAQCSHHQEPISTPTH